MFNKYRFDVGARVECRTGRDEWSVGIIVKLNYSEPDWPPGKIVPYQVQLDDGRLIFVPVDREQLCRLYAPTWWATFFDKPGSYYARNPPPDELRKACKGEDVNVQDHLGGVAIHEAAKCNWRAGVQELLDLGADVNVADREEVTALQIAVQHGTELVDILLKAKADPNCRDKNPDYDPNFTSVSFGDRLEHRTPLHYCCAEGLDEQVKMIPLLIQAKASLDIQDGAGQTPLHLAIEESNDNVVDVLLKSKADVNLGNLLSNMQNSPLMDAAHEGNCSLASKLISAKAEINKAGKQGMSALHLAARRGNAKMARILIEAGADASQASDLGTALDLAKKNGGVELLELLGVKQTPIAESSAKSIVELDAMQRKALFLE